LFLAHEESSVGGGAMTYVENNSRGFLGNLARMEQLLSDTVQATAKEVQHTECLDDEQRSEVFSILHALKNNTDAHRDIVGQWVNNYTGEIHNV
jgi:hypothetical protein